MLQNLSPFANKNNIPKNQKELKENTENYIENLQKNPQKIANFFQHPSVKYACWFFRLFGAGVIKTTQLQLVMGKIELPLINQNILQYLFIKIIVTIK